MMPDQERIEVALIGGPFAMERLRLTKTPPTIVIGKRRYVGIVDPDTKEFLGAYYYAGGVP